MISLRQLEYLVAIVEEGSFTRAAERLHVSQPALSHQVRTLERAVGGPLLERLPWSVRPTQMGRAMLPHACAAVADVERARNAARRASGLDGAELRLATVYSISLGVLPPVLRAWRRARDGVRIRLFEHRHADELVAAMTAGQADLAVGPPPPDWPGPVAGLGLEETRPASGSADHWPRTPATNRIRSPRRSSNCSGARRACCPRMYASSSTNHGS